MLMINPQLYQIDYDCLTRMARRARGQVEALILHWSAGRHDQIFDDYHLSLDGEGNLLLQIMLIIASIGGETHFRL